MGTLLNLSIDLTKIDKSKIIEGKKGGKYYNLTVSINDQKDEYDNDVSAWDSQTKEERESKEQRKFLGNGRVLWSTSQESKQPKQEETKQSDKNDDLPF